MICTDMHPNVIQLLLFHKINEKTVFETNYINRISISSSYATHLGVCEKQLVAGGKDLKGVPQHIKALTRC